MTHRLVLSVMVPPVVSVPRVATWLGWGASQLVRGAPHPHQGSASAQEAAPARPARSWLARACGAMWSALEAQGQRRAAVHLHEMAQRWESIDPERAQHLREAAAFSASASRSSAASTVFSSRGI
jgi:hypothetical protein